MSPWEEMLGTSQELPMSIHASQLPEPQSYSQGGANHSFREVAQRPKVKRALTLYSAYDRVLEFEARWDNVINHTTWPPV